MSHYLLNNLGGITNCEVNIIYTPETEENNDVYINGYVITSNEILFFHIKTI